jgi:hypothetical protein
MYTPTISGMIVRGLIPSTLIILASIKTYVCSQCLDFQETEQTI